MTRLELEIAKATGTPVYGKAATMGSHKRAYRVVSLNFVEGWGDIFDVTLVPYYNHQTSIEIYVNPDDLETRETTNGRDHDKETKI